MAKEKNPNKQTKENRKKLPRPVLVNFLNEIHLNILLRKRRLWPRQTNSSWCWQGWTRFSISLISQWSRRTGMNSICSQPTLPADVKKILFMKEMLAYVGNSLHSSFPICVFTLSHSNFDWVSLFHSFFSVGLLSRVTYDQPSPLSPP